MPPGARGGCACVSAAALALALVIGILLAVSFYHAFSRSPLDDPEIPPFTGDLGFLPAAAAASEDPEAVGAYYGCLANPGARCQALARSVHFEAALTRFRVLEYSATRSLLRVLILTGPDAGAQLWIPLKAARRSPQAEAGGALDVSGMSHHSGRPSRNRIRAKAI